MHENQSRDGDACRAEAGERDRARAVDPCAGWAWNSMCRRRRSTGTFKSKEELLGRDWRLRFWLRGESIYCRGETPATGRSGRRHTVRACAKRCLQYRDGARMVSGTRLTTTEPLKATEKIGAQMVALGFSLRVTVVLLSTIYNYTLSFVMEEQAVFPTPGVRSSRYSIEERNARLDPAIFPHHRRASSILFDHYDRRYREGLELILRGATPVLTQKSKKKSSK